MPEQKKSSEIPADKLAQTAYSAYGEEVKWKTFNNQEMPKWQGSPENIKAAWRAAAIAVVDLYETEQKKH